ncbi:hypothetical protein FRB94_001953 [Tulasnella sp. JGI-2019a]|nr:hypothetical protein FRB94_001953 [Tulasnella sp. JGI-2019a]
MLGRSTISASQKPNNEDRQPLLDDDEEDDHDRSRSNVVFSAEDEDEDNDEDGEGAFHTSIGPPPDYEPPPIDVNASRVPTALKSTVQSREAQYELDDDVLEGEQSPSTSDATMLSARPGLQRNRSSNGQTMPLLVGLMDSSSRRSMDLPMGVPMEDEDDAQQLDLEDLAKKRTAGGGMLDSVANMANSILGAGIIGLPYALSQAGFFTGIALLVVLTFVTDWTIRLIVINAKLSGRSSYIEVMDHCFGRSGKAFVSLFQFAFAFGGMCAFGIIIGDTIPHVIRYVFPSLPTTPILSIFANRQFIIALCTICISYPLSLHRDIHKLSRASGFALVGMLIIVGSVFFEGPHVSPDLKGDPSKRFTIIEPQIFQAIGVISFAFVCHHNSLLIYGSLKTPTLDRFAKVTHISTGLSLVCCLIMAVSAYVVFTEKTQGNILNNFSQTDALINVARFCFGLNMFTTLPLELFVCREVVEQFFFSHEPFSQHRHVLFTTSILFASMIMSMITCDLGVMLEITGGVSATALAFIFPAACYIKLSDPNARWTSRAKLPAYICAGFGIIVMLLSLFLALGKTWSDEGAAKMCS